MIIMPQQIDIYNIIRYFLDFSLGSYTAQIALYILSIENCINLS